MESKPKKKQLKSWSAGIGLTATLAMAVLSVLVSRAPAGAQDFLQAPMLTGSTKTQTTPGNAPETSVATPLFTFTTPEGFAVPH
ncbi:hypothetical protein ACWDTP_20930 [Mycobacterium sp. NPDC003449]